MDGDIQSGAPESVPLLFVSGSSWDILCRPDQESVLVMERDLTSIHVHAKHLEVWIE